MPLSRLVNMFEGVSSTKATTILHDPRWLTAQKCTSWIDGSPESECELVLIYRSALVEDIDTNPDYAAVSQTILEADQVGLLFEALVEDDEMIRGYAYLTVLRFTTEGHDPGPYTDEVVREILQNAMKGELANG